MRCVSPKQIRALLCDKKNEALGTDELGKQMRNNRDVEQLHALNTRRGGPQIREMVNLAMWSALRHTPGFSS